ncbi:MAG: zinc ribbon domain-containing protein [Thermoproteota archaeon]
MNKTNVLAAGVILIAISLYFQNLHHNENVKNILEMYGIDVNIFTILVSTIFLTGIMVSVASILIRPKKKRIIVTPEAPEEPVQRETVYSESIAQGAEVPEEFQTEEAIEEIEGIEEERGLEEKGKAEELEEKKTKEVIGFCPRCGAPVTEGIRYCRKCGLKLK